MKYINEQGMVIEALQWDGGKEGENDMRLKFNIPAGRVIESGDYVFQLAGFSHGILKSANYFKKHFKPISDARVLLVDELAREMLLKLQKCQKDGKLDDWRELGFSVLLQRLDDKILELQRELRNIEPGAGANFDAARKKCAGVGNYAAMIHDLLNAMELEAVNENRREEEEL